MRPGLPVVDAAALPADADRLAVLELDLEELLARADLEGRHLLRDRVDHDALAARVGPLPVDAEGDPAPVHVGPGLADVGPERDLGDELGWALRGVPAV